MKTVKIFERLKKKLLSEVNREEQTKRLANANKKSSYFPKLLKYKTEMWKCRTTEQIH